MLVYGWQETLATTGKSSRPKLEVVVELPSLSRQMREKVALKRASLSVSFCEMAALATPMRTSCKGCVVLVILRPSLET